VADRKEIIVDPDFKEAEQFLRKNIMKRKFIIGIVDCEIRYEGRSSSKLTRGERLFILKPDGAFIVHRRTGYEPVNWQPSGSFASVINKGDHLLLKVVRPRPSEVLEVKIYSIKFIAAFELHDTGVFSMIGDEKDMQEAIKLEPSLVENGLKIIELERKTKPGFIDVLAVDKNGRLVVIELKKNRADEQAVIQLKKYVDSLKREIGGEIRGILVAPGLTRRAQRMLATLKLEFHPLSVEKCLNVLREKKGLVKFLPS